MSRLLAALLLTASLAPAPAVAEPLAVGTRFGAWQLGCEAVAVDETLCFLRQSLTRADTGAFLAELLALPEADGVLLIARVPLGVHLPSGLNLWDGSGAAIAFGWHACTTLLCEARLRLAAETLAQFDTDAAARLGYRPAPGAAPLAFGLSLSGLAAGSAALRAATAPGD